MRKRDAIATLVAIFIAIAWIAYVVMECKVGKSVYFSRSGYAGKQTIAGCFFMGLITAPFLSFFSYYIIYALLNGVSGISISEKTFKNIIYSILVIGVLLNIVMIIYSFHIK